MLSSTNITSEVGLLAENPLVPLEFSFQRLCKLSGTRFVRCAAAEAVRRFSR